MLQKHTCQWLGQEVKEVGMSECCVCKLERGEQEMDGCMCGISVLFSDEIT